MNETIDYWFGPRVLEDGRAVFRLWAPSAESVELVLRDEGSYPLQRRTKRGWYETEPLTARDRARYAFSINGEIRVPDPASRAQDGDVHGWSVYIPELSAGGPRPSRSGWNGPDRQWHESVVYEMHVGAFAARDDEPGSFATVADRLPWLAEVGFNVVELMPVADFPGGRNWGYDGVLPFAADEVYGGPDALRGAIDAAHSQDFGVFLDVVYNHFGPDGNYLHVYAPRFFSEDVPTPWGAGINFAVPEVRRFFIENALFWIHEFGFDGLRLDAIHAISDKSSPHIVTELAQTVRASLPPDRQPHLILENDANQARFLRSPADYHAQWNDDFHHIVHVMLTGEETGYYRDFSTGREERLAKTLTQGFIYQGERSEVHGGRKRGEPSADLSPTRFVSFLQNHDQIGNRAWGERLSDLASPAALHAARALHILAPQIPLIFMGEEWDTEAPFLFFCDFDEELSQAVRDGRRREFGLDEIPDADAQSTYRSSWPGPPQRNGTSELYMRLLALRRAHLVPLLPAIEPGEGAHGPGETVSVRYPSGTAWWCIEVNLTDQERVVPDDPRAEEHLGERVLVYSVSDGLVTALDEATVGRPHPERRADARAEEIPQPGRRLSPWSVVVWKEMSR
jgi:malto-oligosyltrehalose trehalohydrolase